MMSKYRNKPTTIFGIRFDSQKEADHYLVLRDMQEHGEISNLEMQPEYMLVEGYTKLSGETVRPIKYVGDFRYLLPDGIVVVEDVKGSRTTMTAIFRIKRKLFERRYPDIDFRIVT